MYFVLEPLLDQKDHTLAVANPFCGNLSDTWVVFLK